MKREILFRGKRLDSGGWEYGYPHNGFIGTMIIDPDGIVPDGVEYGYGLDKYCLVDPATVGQYVFLEDVGYVYRKNDVSVSWQYRSDSTENWFKIAYELKGWIEKKNKEPVEYISLTRYLIFFAAFFDAKMEYHLA